MRLLALTLDKGRFYRSVITVLGHVLVPEIADRWGYIPCKSGLNSGLLVNLKADAERELWMRSGYIMLIRLKSTYVRPVQQIGFAKQILN